MAIFLPLCNILHCSIQPKDITSLKALKNPPDVVKRIFDCVLLLRYM
jgi:hypothetical protein